MDNLGWSVERVLPSVLADLHQLIAIPSVSSMPEHDADVAAAGDLVAGLLQQAGAAEVRMLEAGGKPAVYAHFPAPEGQPTVLLYAHYDVQPTGDEAAWDSAPFAPEERQGRLYGRGAADDKGGFAAHMAALRVFDGKPPVGVKLLIEGEEEIGSPTIVDLMDTFADELSADVYVIADSVNWDSGKPSLTTTLRGNIDAVVTVSTARGGLHSGGYGGVAPDAVTALCRLIATLHDERGNVAIEGLTRYEGTDLEYPEDRLAGEIQLLDGVQQLGDGSVVERMWYKPTASVLAIDTTRIKDASNTLIPSASAKISLRLAPGQDVEQATEAFHAHLRQHVPWGAHIEIEAGRASEASVISLESEHAQIARQALAEAFGEEPVETGVGGSIPMVAAFAERYPDATVLVTAVVDPYSRMHSNNESLSLVDLGKAAHAEVLLLTALAR